MEVEKRITSGVVVKALILSGMVAGLAACGGGSGDGGKVSPTPGDGDSGGDTGSETGQLVGWDDVSTEPTSLEGDWAYCNYNSAVSTQVVRSFRGNAFYMHIYRYSNGGCRQDGSRVLDFSVAGRFELGEEFITNDGLPARGLDEYVRRFNGVDGVEQMPQFNIVSVVSDTGGMLLGDLSAVDDPYEDRTTWLELDESFQRFERDF